MTTWLGPSPDFKCTRCKWKGPATALDGPAENECPKCGAKAERMDTDGHG